MRQRIPNFFFLSLQLKHAYNTYSNISETFLNPTDILFQPGTQTVIYIISQVNNDNEVTGIMPPYPYLEDNDDPIICPALTTAQKKQCIVFIINFLEHPNALKKECHFATF